MIILITLSLIHFKYFTKWSFVCIFSQLQFTKIVLEFNGCLISNDLEINKIIDLFISYTLNTMFKLLINKSYAFECLFEQINSFDL